MRAVAREVAEDVPSARRRLAGLDGRAADAGFRINGDTSVHDRRPDDDESGRAEVKGDLEFQARDVLRLVRDIDSDAAGRLRAISSSKRSWGIMNPSLGERPPLGPDASDILFRLGEERKMSSGLRHVSLRGL